MTNKLRYLLLQVRNADDPMRLQEVRCFSRVLQVDPSQIEVADLLSESPDAKVDHVDMVLLGGSGHYSVASEGEWLDRALEAMRKIHTQGKPTFASCWGFQAMARATGGTVIHDLAQAELGTHELRLTPAGRDDPIFGPLGDPFLGQMGHEDRVSELPPGTTLLASTSLVENQAYRFDDLPIYCTQFHPELNRQDLLQRVEIYPEYIERIAKLPPERFGELCSEAPETESLLRRFVEVVFG